MRAMTPLNKAAIKPLSRPPESPCGPGRWRLGQRIELPRQRRPIAGMRRHCLRMMQVILLSDGYESGVLHID
jgi:hypothetical protein